MLVVLVAIMPVLAGCDSFDPDNLDIFGLSGKDKLPGKRELLFPGGVPGVTQGIPPQYVEGYKSPLESEPLPPGDSDNPQTANAAGAPAAAAARKAGHPTAMAHGRPMQIAPVREFEPRKAQAAPSHGQAQAHAEGDRNGIPAAGQEARAQSGIQGCVQAPVQAGADGEPAGRNQCALAVDAAATDPGGLAGLAEPAAEAGALAVGAAFRLLLEVNGRRAQGEPRARDR